MEDVIEIQDESTMTSKICFCLKKLIKSSLKNDSKNRYCSPFTMLDIINKTIYLSNKYWTKWREFSVQQNSDLRDYIDRLMN